jgi:hypothetical protein
LKLLRLLSGCPIIAVDVSDTKLSGNLAPMLCSMRTMRILPRRSRN